MSSLEILPRLVVVGHVCLDVNEMPSTTQESHGGAGYFAALAASSVAPHVGLVSRVGVDYDTELLFQRVVSQGVRISDLPTMRSTQTYFSSTDLTQRKIEVVMGAGGEVSPEDFPQAWYESAQVVHVATMPPAQQRLFLEFLRQNAPAIEISIDTDLMFLQDQDSREMVKENFRLADRVFANRREYDILQDVIDVAPKAVVKLDQDGAVLFHRGQEQFRYSVPRVAVVDATGAGDIVAGVYLGLLVQGVNERECLMRAVEKATYSVQFAQKEQILFSI